MGAKAKRYKARSEIEAAKARRLEKEANTQRQRAVWQTIRAEQAERRLANIGACKRDVDGKNYRAVLILSEYEIEHATIDSRAALIEMMAEKIVDMVLRGSGIATRLYYQKLPPVFGSGYVP